MVKIAGTYYTILTLCGLANDAAPVPPTSPTHGSYHWTFERYESPFCSSVLELLHIRWTQDRLTSGLGSFLLL